MVYEIEVKSLLSEEKYKELKESLPQKFRKINEDTITTIRFRPKDVRIRYSNKINEVIFKDGDPTTLSRKEISVNLKDMEDCTKMRVLLNGMGFNEDPSWIKRKEEFVCDFEGFQYILSLQHIENFAFLLEAEIMSENKEDEIHISNLKRIIENLGCQPIEPEEFKLKISEYIKNNSK